MALSDKNILITPNIGQTADPNIVFSGADASTSAQNITVQVYPTSNGTLSFEGSAGQLFSITNSLSGTIFSVNDVSGIPSIEVLDTGLIKLGEFGGNVLIGTATDNGTDKLQVNGSITSTGNLIVNVNSTSDALRITQVGSGNALVVEDSANPDSTPFVIDASGIVVIGTTAKYAHTSSLLQVSGAAIRNVIHSANPPSGGSINFDRSRGDISAPTVVASADVLFDVKAFGYDGATYINAASITAAVDGTPGTNDMPGRLVFSTTADGASSPIERMRIDSAGNVGIGIASATGYSILSQKNITGATTAYGMVGAGLVQSDVTSTGSYFHTSGRTAAAAFTLANMQHFTAAQATIGAGSTVTNQYGFQATSTLTGATNNYGFYGNIATGTGRWNFYANGTADNYFGGPTTISVNSTSDALRITQTGSGNALVVEDAANPDSTPVVIDTSGNVVVGSSTSVPQLAFTPQLQVHSTSVAGINVTRWVNSAAEPNILISKSRGASVGTYASVQSGDGLGILSWTGDDGTAFIQAASIRAAVDGTPGTNDMPGRLMFSTTADGASTPTERVRLNSAGNVLINTTVDNGTDKLQVNGSISAGAITADSYTVTGAGGDFSPASGIEAWYITNNFSVASADTEPRDISFSSDGTKVYMLGNAGNDITQYTLSVAWDITTASTPVVFSVSAQEATPYGLFFKPDGTKFYVAGTTGDNIYQYALSSAWDISTSSWEKTFTVTGQETDPNAVFFKPDGTKMYVTGSTGDDVNEYNLGTPWDIATATYSTVYLFSAYEVSPQGLSFSSDGTKFWVVGTTYNRIAEFTMSTPWSIASASFNDYVNLYYVQPDESTLYTIAAISGIYVNESQNKAWITDYTTDRIFELKTDAITTKFTGNKFSVESQLFSIKNSLIVNRNLKVNGEIRQLGSAYLGAAYSATFNPQGATSTFSLGTSTTTGAFNLATGLTTSALTIGGTAQTGITTLGRSTATNIINIGTGVTASGSTQTINFGTGGASGSTTAINIGSATGSTLSISGTATIDGNTVWHAGNDGAGSGLDADLLDGITSASFLRSDTGDTFSGGILTVANTAGALGSSLTAENTLQIYQATASTDAFMTFHVSGDHAVHFGLDGTTNDLFVGGWSAGAVKNKVWHAGNLTNLNQLTNGPGYITGYTETDTLATVTARGNSTSTVMNTVDIRSQGQIRATGWYNINSGSYTGLGTEIGVSGGQSYILSYNRDASTYGVLNITATYTNVDNSLRTPIFYDYNDTGYYVDPASTSRVSTTITNLSYFGSDTNKGFAQGWNTYSSSLHKIARITFDWNGNYDTENHGIFSTNSAGEYTDNMSINSYNDINLRLDSNNNDNASYVRFHMHTTGSGQFAYIGYNGSNYENFFEGITYTPDMRADIFYERTDTSYYVNPNGTSSMWNVAIRGDNDNTGISTQIFFWGAGSTTTSAIGFKANGGSFPNPTGFGDGYNTYLTMDTDGRGWVFRRGTGGSDFTAVYTSGWILNNGIWQANSSMRSPIFYDSDDTSYYVSPNGTTYLNIAYTNQSYTYGWFRNYGVQGMYNQDYGTHWYADSTAYWNIGNGQGSYCGIKFRPEGHQTTIRGYVYADTSNNIGFLNQDGSWRLRVVAGDYTLSEGSSMRAPLFYDSNNTSYYIDPNADLAISVYGEICNSNFAQGNLQPGALNIGRTDTDYRWEGSTWSSTVNVGILANCSEYWELAIHDSNDSVKSVIYFDGSSTIYMGKDLGWDVLNFYCYGNISAYSDARNKENVVTIDNALDKTLKLRGVYYNKIDDISKTKQVGVIAQEVLEVLPEAVTLTKEGDYGVHYGNMVALLIEAIKEQQTQISKQQEMIEKLTLMVLELKK